MNTQPSPQPACADRVADHWQSRREDLHRMLIESAPSEGYEDAYDEFCEYGLSWDYVEPGTFDDQPEGYWRYQISWGGPAEEIRFWISADTRMDYRGNPCRPPTLDRAEFWFLDWWDGAPLDVTDDEVAQAVFEWFAELYSDDMMEQVWAQEVYNDEQRLLDEEE